MKDFHMETNRLRILLEVAEQGNMTKVAEEQHYTQSAVSHMMSSLEADIGLPLFSRYKGRLIATAECRRLLPLIKQVLSQEEQLEAVIADIKGLTTGKVRIGTFTSMSVNWLPKIIRLFQERYPDVEIELVEGGDQELTRWLEEGRIDLGFGRYMEELSRGWIHLYDDSLMAVLPGGSPYEGPVPLKAFHRTPYIALPSYYDVEVKELLSREGIVPDVKFYATDDYTIISMVAEGLGCCILPELVLQGYRHCNIKALPLEPYQKRPLGIVVPSLDMISPASDKFIECAMEVIQQKP